MRLRYLFIRGLQMGAHLSSPRTEKVSSNGGDFKLDPTIFGSSSMQGWRISMEDAHLTLPNFLFKTTGNLTPGPTNTASGEVSSGKSGANSFVEQLSAAGESEGGDCSAGKLKGSIYGVFDGHGGNCVSRWVSENFSYIFTNELESLIATAQGLGSDVAKYSDNPTEAAETTPTDTATPTNTTAETPVNPSGTNTPTFSTTTPESHLIGRALENSFLKLDEYLQKPEVDKQLHLISTNKKSSGDNLFKVLLPEKITNRQHAIDIIQQLTSSYNISYSGASVAKTTEKLNKYDSIPYYGVDSSTEAEGSDREMEEINTELGLDAVPNAPSDDDGLQALRANTENAQPNMEVDALETENTAEDALNSELYAMGCGSTSVVAVVLEDPVPCLIVANAGDSRCVLSRNKVAVPLSVDHKPTDEPELNRIKNAGGYVINGRVDGNLNLSRSLGDLSFKLDNSLSTREQKIISFPDVKILPLTKEDEFLILACDGIWDCKSNQQVVDYVNYKYTLYTEGEWEDAKEGKKVKAKTKSGEKTAGANSSYGESVFDLASSSNSFEKGGGGAGSNIRMEGDGAKERKVLEKICEELCDMCLSNNPSESEGIGCDNMTIIIVKFNHQLYQKI
ncbi:protein phosphatase 2C homolog 2 [Theileria orientalis strain Shintoku]|uniref:protein-serine/threonine phosphatase n=1 Tax=Theileria orientalis strain Shintoku TaxID=869250 RepID=J4CD73_THEOR|nr:protein phosphatase 2C homolog 2 [Theileria orientalis strain Shintoku]BAM40642.1 protein phosphatase 2C homolog 2 [Theileria orientalis strain Shintoku]|eukprot:XP_009690943.1 protein phosphatase 2C homolog 2 [Theileria orientalis strain Shintoku]